MIVGAERAKIVRGAFGTFGGAQKTIGGADLSIGVLEHPQTYINRHPCNVLNDVTNNANFLTSKWQYVSNALETTFLIQIANESVKAGKMTSAISH